MDIDSTPSVHFHFDDSNLRSAFSHLLFELSPTCAKMSPLEAKRTPPAQPHPSPTTNQLNSPAPFQLNSLNNSSLLNHPSPVARPHLSSPVLNDTKTKLKT
jgi:hypothetical protein